MYVMATWPRTGTKAGLCRHVDTGPFYHYDSQSCFKSPVLVGAYPRCAREEELTRAQVTIIMNFGLDKR